MKTDFSGYISSFFAIHLPNERGASKNTIQTYSFAFELLFLFLSSVKNRNIDRLSLSFLTKKIILEFLDWLEINRKCSPTSRNLRLAAIKAFFTYLKNRPKHLSQVLDVLSINPKKAGHKTPTFLTVDGIKLLLEQPNTRTIKGKRDLALIALLYDSGARVQELIDLTPSSLNFKKPSMITLIGKGNKSRTIPLNESQLVHLKIYMEKRNMFDQANCNIPLFSNSRGKKFSRVGINNILKKYINAARARDNSLFVGNLSCHSLRHSKAMHLLDAEVHLVYIRDFLGHSSITTTERYARLSTVQKAKAMAIASNQIIAKFTPETGGDLSDSKLLSLVRNFSRSS